MVPSDAPVASDGSTRCLSFNLWPVCMHRGGARLQVSLWCSTACARTRTVGSSTAIRSTRLTAAVALRSRPAAPSPNAAPRTPTTARAASGSGKPLARLSSRPNSSREYPSSFSVVLSILSSLPACCQSAHHCHVVFLRCSCCSAIWAQLRPDPERPQQVLCQCCCRDSAA